MGLFDRFNKKSKQDKHEEVKDPDTVLRETLKNKFEHKGHSVCLEDGVIYADGEIGILIENIENPNLHPRVMQVGIRTAVQDYFGRGISEVLVGIGNSIEEKAESAVDNYMTAAFPVILESLSDLHDPNLDFTTNETREILWHPKLGQLIFQGKWDSYPKQEYLFQLLKDWLKDNMSDRKFNWLKLYLSKQDNGNITGDCSLNNDFREDGFRIIEEYAKNWDNGGFKGIKQFIIIRRCDKFDTNEEINK